MAPSQKRALTSPASTLGALNRQTLREEIAGKIAALIGSRLLQLGDQLPSERELAASLSVSRETVRGAIRLLSERGIVEVVRGAGSRIITTETRALPLSAAGRVSVSSYGLEDVHAARLLLEREAVRQAAERIDGGTLAMLERLIAAQGEMLDDAPRFLLCDREFHETIYRAGGNALVADLSMDLYGYLADRRRDMIAEPGQIAASIEDHRAIFAGLSARDPEAAAEAFAEHERRIYATTKLLIERGRRAQTSRAPAAKAPPNDKAPQPQTSGLGT